MYCNPRVSADVIVSDSYGNNITWTLDSSGELLVSGEGAMYDPSGLPSWREYSDSITSVIIDEGITNICWGAFSDCNQMTSIHLPSSLLTIDNNAFYGCNSLTDIVIPYGITTISNLTFGMCSTLKNVSIPDSVTTIESYAFNGCEQLNKLIYRGLKRQWESVQIAEENDNELARVSVYFQPEKIFEGIQGTLNWGITMSANLIIDGNSPLADFLDDEGYWLDHKEFIQNTYIGKGVSAIGINHYSEECHKDWLFSFSWLQQSN